MRLFPGLVGAAIFAIGCGSGTGEVTSGSGGPDGGPDVIKVILDGGGDPVAPPDGASMCPQGGICNYQTGVGCPADHPSCIPASDANNVVTPACNVAGTGVSGSACASVTDCVAGHMCVEGACHKLCCGGDWTGCDGPSDHCIKKLLYGNGKGGTVQTNAMLCYPINTCDALVPNGCPQPGTTCQIADTSGVTACLPENAGGTGAACPCKGGFVCVIGETGGECHRLCKAVEGGGDPLCQQGEGVCVHYTRDPGGVGECTP